MAEYSGNNLDRKINNGNFRFEDCCLMCFLVFGDVLAEVDLVVVGDAVHDGGQTQQAGGRRGLTGSWK